MLDIGMSELINSTVYDIYIERSSSNVFEESYTSLSDTCGKVTYQILGRGLVATYWRRHLLVENDTK